MIGNQTVYKFREIFHSIYKDQKEFFKGSYKVVERLSKSEPSYRDDYIEPYEYKTCYYVVIEDIETKKQYMLDETYFKCFFDPVFDPMGDLICR